MPTGIPIEKLDPVDIAVQRYDGSGHRPDFRVLDGSVGKKPRAGQQREEGDAEAGRGRFAPPGPGTLEASPCQPRAEETR